MINRLLLGLALAISLVTAPAFGQMPTPANQLRVAVGSGETLVYGPDAFTGTNGTELQVYDSNWAEVHGSDRLEISSNALRVSTTAATSEYKYTPATAVGQKIKCDIFTNNSGNYPGLELRHDANTGASATYYLMELDAGENKFIIYRVTTGPTYVELARAGAVAIETTYTGVYFKATGTNPVLLEGGYDSNTNLVSYSDSAADRHQSGSPGISVVSAGVAANGPTVDNCSIYSIP